MTDVTQYKCPACGGKLEFNSTSQNMKCPYCDSEFTIEEATAAAQADAVATQHAHTGADTQDIATGDTWSDEETEHIHVYVCESCAGEIVADDTTGATTCPYCGNRVVMKGQFAGDLKPDAIIPFKFDKKQAKEAYYKHIHKKPFLPAVFKAENHIDEIKGVYVPFWLFSMLLNTSVSYDATDTRHWTSGKTHYTETKYYEGSIGGSLSFENVAADASSKMADDLMESIEPFDYGQAVDFNPAYLSGYMADRYDADLGERFNRAKERADHSSQDEFLRHAHCHETITKRFGESQVTSSSYTYALYPVWLLSTTWRDQHFLFAMNGQTGKMVGDLPADMKQFWFYVLTRGLACSVVTTLLLALFMML